MPTSRMRRTSPASAWSFGCAALLGVQVLALAALPFEPVEPADKVVHGLSLAALTLLLWMATDGRRPQLVAATAIDRKSTRLNSSHVKISYAVFCLKKKNRK